MTGATNNGLLEHFNHAIEQPVGIELEVSDLDAFRRRFYALKQELAAGGDSRYQYLSLVTPPSASRNKIWLVNRTAAQENPNA